MEYRNDHVINRLYNFDLDILQSGYQKTENNYFHGPSIRDQYIIHYIISGRGIVLLNNKIYEVCQGQAFIIFPNEVYFYQADEFDPWEYTWIGFNGLKADNFFDELGITSKSNPILTFDTEPLSFIEIQNIHNTNKHYEVRLLGLLYLMFYDLLDQHTQSIANTENLEKSSSTYAAMAKDFINKNYYKNICIEDIARYIGLNKNYLSTIFRASFNISIKNYILDLRINKACELLKETDMTIFEISSAIGYDDRFQFSKIFKKYTDYSPKEYRQSSAWNNIINKVIEL